MGNAGPTLGAGLGGFLTLSGLVFTCVALGTLHWLKVEVIVDAAMPARGLVAGDTAVTVIQSMFRFDVWLFPGTQYESQSAYWFSDHRNDPSVYITDGDDWFYPERAWSSASAVFSLNIIALVTMVPALVACALVIKGKVGWSFGCSSIFVLCNQLCAIIILYTTLLLQTQNFAMTVYTVAISSLSRVPTHLKVTSQYSAILFDTSFAIFGFTTLFIAPLIFFASRDGGGSRSGKGSNSDKGVSLTVPDHSPAAASPAYIMQPGQPVAMYPSPAQPQV